MRIAEAEFATQAQKIIGNVIINNFSQRGTSRATDSTAHKRADDGACYATNSDSRWPSNSPQGSAQLRATCRA